jgi:tRNA pseudouridine38-40 synthase
MEAACGQFVGAKDYRHFSKHDPEREDYRSIVEHVKLRKCELGIVFEIRANRFLPQMARRIVGTIVAIGSGEATSESIERTFAGDVEKRIFVAPPHGLFLIRVSFDRHDIDTDHDCTTGTWRYVNEVLH